MKVIYENGTEREMTFQEHKDAFSDQASNGEDKDFEFMEALRRYIEPLEPGWCDITVKRINEQLLNEGHHLRIS